MQINDVERDYRLLPSIVNTPLGNKYHPEMDITAFLDEDYTRWFH